MDAAQRTILDAVACGATIEEAAVMAEINIHTIRSWLQRGRKGGPLAEFAKALDDTRAARKNAEAELDGPLTDHEAELLIAKAARKGSVPALRLHYERQSAKESSRRGAGAAELLERVFDDGT